MLPVANIVNVRETHEAFSIESSEEAADLQVQLIDWPVRRQITHAVFSDLLKIIFPQNIPELPKDSRTFLKTKTNFEARNVSFIFT